MSAHDRHHGIREAHPLQNLRAYQGVNFHLLELFRRQPAGFRDDMFGHGQLADVVQQCGGMQRFQIASLHPQFFGDFDGINADALQVIVGCLVLGFNGQRQGLDGSQMKVRNFFHMPLLVFQLAQIEAVGPVDQINGWDKQQRSFPVEFAVEPANRACNTGSDQVIRERPEVAVHQNLSQRFAFAHRNHNGNASGIHDEIDRSCQTQDQRMTGDELVGQSVVIDEISQGGRQGTRTNVERQLECAGPVWIQTLGQHGSRAQGKGLSVAQFRHRHQDKQEVHRKRARDAGQDDTQP